MLAPQAEAALASTIRSERVRFIFVQSALPIFFSPVGAGILPLAIWDMGDRQRLLYWNAGMILLALGRLALLMAFPRRRDSGPDMRWWEKAFGASIVIVGLWWGLGGLAPLVPDSPHQQAIVFAFLILMAGGTGASYAAHPTTVTLAVFSLAGPITVYFLAQPNTVHRTMAVGAVMFLLANLRSFRTLSMFFTRSYRLAQELQQEKARVEELARMDFLTGLNNRRAFYEAGEATLKHAERYGHPAVAVMLDIDHFKKINDQHGHSTGDEAIKLVAQMLRKIQRSTDISGRLGGEEFAVLLPETSLEEALRVAERMRAAIEGNTLVAENAKLQFTTSVGVAVFTPGETLQPLLARADEALYAAKRAGRNLVRAAA